MDYSTHRQTVTVIGDGGWGTALALVAHANGHLTRLWGAFPDYVEQMRAAGENTRFLPGVPLPPALELTADGAAALRGADLAILAVPTKYFRETVGRFRGLVPAGATVASVAKGLDRVTHRRMSDLAAELLGIDDAAALSGPSHAEEVGRNVPTAVVVAARREADARRVQSMLSNTRFRIYTSPDVVGVELGGALKNVIAIAVGVSDGLGFGDNTRAALITRGLAEMTRLGAAMGADPATFAGLSGMGDLIVTCTSRLSRNRAFGERLGRGETAEAILGDMRQAVEGAWNCASAAELAREREVRVPVTDEVRAIVHDGKAPTEAVDALLSRDPRSE